MPKLTTTMYRGSKSTAECVGAQIVERYGEAEAKNYNPQLNCKTFKQWIQDGFKVKKGEKALKSYTLIEMKDKHGDVTKRRRTVNLFYILQVEPLNA